MFTSIVIVVVLTQYGPVPWPWAVVIGALSTCAIALLTSLVRKRLPKEMYLTLARKQTDNAFDAY